MDEEKTSCVNEEVSDEEFDSILTGKKFKNVNDLEKEANFEANVLEEERRERLEYLLQQTEAFSEDVMLGDELAKGKKKRKNQAMDDEKIKKKSRVIDSLGESGKAMKRIINQKNRLNENKEVNREDEDEEEVVPVITEKNDEKNNEKEKENGDVIYFQNTPSFIQNGELRDYQIRGLNWLISCHSKNINGILADEMGLGKTLQTISMIGYLKIFLGRTKPFLVIVPKSTLNNWKMEFEKWCPSLNVFILFGTKDERELMGLDKMKNNRQWDVVITTYELVIIERHFFRPFKWEYLVIDEAHRLKNEKSRLAVIVRRIKATHRLLLTGTPLQNNLHELWALLNFLVPEIFDSSDDFDTWFDTNTCLDNQELVERLHAILKPFLLRRLKSEVEKTLKPKEEVKLYVKMAKLQKETYKRILLRELEYIIPKSTTSSSNSLSAIRLNNILMQLRKCANHPYMIPGIEPGPPYTTDEHLIESSGKLLLLDKLLFRLKEEGRRILLFSGMVRLLDILEDYLLFRKYSYRRLDGTTSHQDRYKTIDEFNKENSSIFIFIISTRAGGLGINLATADTVIFYDSDWNPQVDLQATDRAHRIGQKGIVKVFRLLSDQSVDERIINLAEKKLRLDHVIIQQGRKDGKSGKNLNKDNILSIIRGEAKKLQMNCDDDSSTIDESLDEILKRGQQRTKEEKEKIKEMNENELKNFTFDVDLNIDDFNVYNFEGYNYKSTTSIKSTNKALDNYSQLINGKRERKKNKFYYFDETVNQKKMLKPPKQPNIYDHQFYPVRLLELLEKEIYAYRKANRYKVPKKSKNAVYEQEKIDSAQPLTKEEMEEKENLLKEGFSNWTRRDFLQFVKSIEKWGEEDMYKVCLEIPSKTPKEVYDYNEVFWKRKKELLDHERINNQIKKGKNRREKMTDIQCLLMDKYMSSISPEIAIKLNYGTGKKNKNYQDIDDQQLACYLHRFGMSHQSIYEKMRMNIRQSPLNSFNWFFKSRNCVELQKRCNSVVGLLEKESHLIDEQMKKMMNSSLPFTDHSHSRKRRRTNDDTSIPPSLIKSERIDHKPNILKVKQEPKVNEHRHQFQKVDSFGNIKFYL
ncbi:hypothetical protein SNEBB_007410 [Seison nebaliae]|nr:hypothetical protein SNEBB_007410 [Seison nebaliae]